MARRGMRPSTPSGSGDRPVTLAPRIGTGASAVRSVLILIVIGQCPAHVVEVGAVHPAQTAVLKNHAKDHHAAGIRERSALATRRE